MICTYLSKTVTFIYFYMPAIRENFKKTLSKDKNVKKSYSHLLPIQFIIEILIQISYFCRIFYAFDRVQLQKISREQIQKKDQKFGFWPQKWLICLILGKIRILHKKSKLLLLSTLKYLSSYKISKKTELMNLKKSSRVFILDQKITLNLPDFKRSKKFSDKKQFPLFFKFYAQNL